MVLMVGEREANGVLCEALAVVNKAVFRNALVAMKPKATRKDLPSSHEVQVYIHNAFVEWLKSLKEEFQVSKFQHFEASTHPSILGSTRPDFVNSRWVDCRYNKGVVSGDDSALDGGEASEMEVT